MSDPELIPVEDRPAVLVIAGLDPSGGAGLTLDSAIIRAFGLHPLPVATGVAVQNTARLARRHDMPADLVMEQLQVLGGEFLLGAVKVGMIGRLETAEKLGAWLADRPRLPVVLDPVLRSSSGGALGESGMEQALLRHLVPRARVLTPNVDEAAALTGAPVNDRDDVPRAARALRERGAAWVLVKGGHLPRARAADYLCGADEELWVEVEESLEREVRGTGCALASGIAAGLALGESVPEAVRAAKLAVTRAMNGAYVAGQGKFLEPGRSRPRP